MSLGYIEKVLVLSTAHMPSEAPDFGPALRAVDHEYGFVVFVSPMTKPEYIPEWLRPIHAAAAARGCTLILFDRDGNEEPGFQTWDW